MLTRPVTLLAGLALAAATALSACSSAGSHPAAAAGSTAGSAAEANQNLDLGTPLGGKQAPDFTLTNQFGAKMSLSQFKGKVTLLAFEDPVCTTVCPLTTQSMLLAKELLGPAGKSVQLLGVAANPDASSVADVKAYSQAHGLTNQWDFLTGPLAQLRTVWKAYGIAVQVQAGQIDHTPALYLVDAQGRLQKVYLTQMAYSSVTQSAQVIASATANLLPSHPQLSTVGSLAAIPAQTPADRVALPAAPTVAAAPGTTGRPVALGPGQPHLVFFFATWLTEVSDLNAELKSLNAYARFAAAQHLPGPTAVDETVTETSRSAVTAYLHQLGPLSYPVGLDETGRVADGYGVQDQPWVTLVDANGKIVWQHDGWVPLAGLEKTVRAHS